MGLGLAVNVVVVAAVVFVVLNDVYVGANAGNFVATCDKCDRRSVVCGCGGCQMADMQHGDTQTPASRRVQDWVLQERGRGNSGWPCHLLDRAGCK